VTTAVNTVNFRRMTMSELELINLLTVSVSFMAFGIGFICVVGGIEIFWNEILGHGYEEEEE
jgi:hypothetical protein